MAAIALAPAQSPPDVQLQHLYTFGSKPGIHPPRILNRRPVKAALGEGDHPWGLAVPVAVTTDRRNRVWITDTGTASVHVFDKASGAYREFRRAGDFPFLQPSGIASDEPGRVYVADAATGAVFVFDENGEYDRALVKPASGLLESPSAIAISDDQRTVYVADSRRNVVLALNREGEVNTTIPLPPELSEPSGLVVIRNQIYVLGGRHHKIGGFSPAGFARGPLQFDGVLFPTAFAWDRARRRFLVANPRWMVVQVFDEDARNLGVFGHLGDAVDQMQHVDGVHVDAQGLVYVVDSRGGKVLVFAESPPR